MDARNPNPNPVRPPSMRVLTRPPAPFPDPHPPPQPPPQGVVVVGFISQTPAASSHLINRVLDSNAFGSGNLDSPFSLDDKDELKEWFGGRKISYFYEEEKGLLFLQFCSTRCPVFPGFSGSSSGLDSVLDDLNFEELRGLLFMFSVCHIIVYIQEGSRFDTRILKKFRMLQSAKKALAPYVRSRATPPLPSRAHSSLSSSRPTSSAGSSPSRSSSIASRSSSAISFMSGLGSQVSLYPGHCTPVILFVFIDDFPEVGNSSSFVDESTDNNSLNQSSSSSSFARPNLSAKGSSTVVMLARSVNKSEGGFRKKLQSSLEAQIRFLIKKCRTLSGLESGHPGSRSGGVPSSAPLFSLDASRAVALLDKSTNQRNESLEFVIDLVEDVLNGKATSDSFLLESHSQNANKEDILVVKEFIYRQADILRGRGGLVANANGGPATGVGMVAVAAAAAAASAASGKAFAAPELPSFELWLSSSKLILNGILSANCGNVNNSKEGKPIERNISQAKFGGIASKGMEPIDVAISVLESGQGLNSKFSTLWCEKALPTSVDVYLKDLPSCYPTSQHEAQLEKALCYFLSMVRGPAVELFAKKVEDECLSIWKSGRQQCDAVSLTGKPCMHHRHEVGDNEHEGAPVKSHSSGYFFLHACACGRSRQLRPDPFDIESANVSFNIFPDCDKLLPAVQLPEGNCARLIQPSSWRLTRIGGASYYEPFNGLLQSGFSARERFLLKWKISLQETQKPWSLPVKNMLQDPVDTSGVGSKIELGSDIDFKRNGMSQFHFGNISMGLVNQTDLSGKSQVHDTKFSSGILIPNFTMRKPFAEVVAGSAASDSKFPPSKQRKQLLLGSDKRIMQSIPRDQSAQGCETGDQASQKSEDSSHDIANGITSIGGTGYDPLLQVGDNAAAVNGVAGKIGRWNVLSKQAIVYVGFEYECPHGHRFILSLDQLNELGTLDPLLEMSVPSMETLGRNMGDSLKNKNGNHGKIHHSAKNMAVALATKLRNTEKSGVVVENGNLSNEITNVPGSRKYSAQASVTRADSHSLDNLHMDLHALSLDDGGNAFSLLNRDLPLFINCPYCRKSKNKKDVSRIKFAGTVSQLQRIFVVTPQFPVVLATCLIIQFAESCLPLSVPDRERKLQFSLGSQVVLPPESFVVLRLPFVYGVQLEDGSQHFLKPFDDQPERTALVVKGTALQIISKKSNISDNP